jgi:predicted SprT family Zn-dependent metalloprotease
LKQSFYNLNKAVAKGAKQMRIEFDEANKILRSNNGKPCKQHDWVEEVHNGSKTGDYRCKNCGATIYEQEYKQQK